MKKDLIFLGLAILLTSCASPSKRSESSLIENDAAIMSHAAITEAEWQALPPSPTLPETPKVVYPFEEARAERGGIVRVTFKVDAHGRAKDVEVIYATRAIFVPHVMIALDKWRFLEQGGPYRLEIVFTPLGKLSGRVDLK